MKSPNKPQFNSARQPRRVSRRNYQKSPYEFKPGKGFGKWTLQNPLGLGGNGEVWRAVNPEGQSCAIKILKKLTFVAHTRFKDEIKILSENQDIPGIMPLRDYYIPAIGSSDFSWYVIDVAESLETRLLNASTKEIVNAFIDLAGTLSILHSRDIVHRDIKPGNILWYSGSFCLSDFGLAKYPKKSVLTRSNERVGPRHTMPPEATRHASTADGKAMDVYELAKTLWMSLTRDFSSFEGQYRPDSPIGLKNFIGGYLTTLDNLIESSTLIDPMLRPSASQFQHALQDWLKISSNYNSFNPFQWIDCVQEIFPLNIPTRAHWENNEDIIKIINLLAKKRDMALIIDPENGHLEIDFSQHSSEGGCIEIFNSGLFNIFKPSRLHFYCSGGDPEWSFFMLQTAKLERKSPEWPLTSPPDLCEYLVELRKDNYITVENWESIQQERLDRENDSQYYDDDYNNSDKFTIRQKERYVRRYLGGSFMIINKRSVYNLYLADQNYHANLAIEPFEQVFTTIKDKFEQLRSDGRSLDL